MSQPVFVTPYIEAAWKAARAKYPEQHGTWIDLSARLAGRISIVPLMMNVQRLGDLDLLLRAMEDEASANSSSLRGMSMAFHYQLMLSETWVVVCYEALRVVRDRERKAAALELAKDPAFLQDDISSLASFKAIFHDVELLRMPITKYEIAKDSKMKGALNLRAIPANGDATDDRVYEKTEIEVAVAEAWNWLEVQGLLVPAPGTNGANGWRVLSRKAQKLSPSDDVRQFAKSRWIPKEMLHHRIADKVWAAFIRSEFDVAAFQAMKAVEIYVREAGKFDAGDIGTDLMRKAFHEENGPLTDKSAERSERQARSSLFAGAIGSYKNPHSHRDVDINGPEEAMEIVLLANHLLRIVDGRLSPGRKKESHD